MSIVSLVATGRGAEYKWALNELLRPFAEMFAPAPYSLLIYVGAIYPAGPELGVNPHPALVAALAEWAYEAGVANIGLVAAAADGFEFSQSWQLAGYGALKGYGADVLDMADAPRSSRLSSLGLNCREFLLPKPLLQADYLINLSKFRVAEGRMFGSALNNLAAMADMPRAEEAFPRALVDLYSVITPDLHIADALRGQGGWQPQTQDGLLAATDAVALDMTLATLAGLDGSRMEEIALAAQYGLGSAGAADISLTGDAAALFGAGQGKNKPATSKNKGR